MLKKKKTTASGDATCCSESHERWISFYFLFSRWPYHYRLYTHLSLSLSAVKLCSLVRGRRLNSFISPFFCLWRPYLNRSTGQKKQKEKQKKNNNKKLSTIDGSCPFPRNVHVKSSIFLFIDIDKTGFLLGLAGLVGLDWVRLGLAGLDWVHLSWTELLGLGFYWVKLVWLGWTGLDWVWLGSFGFNWVIDGVWLL